MLGMLSIHTLQLCHRFFAAAAAALLLDVCLLTCLCGCTSRSAHEQQNMFMLPEA
jgi:hypothetical protein